MSLPIIGGFIVILAVGFVIGYFFSKLIAERRRNSAEGRVQKLLEDSRQEAKEILIEAKNKAVKVIEEAQGELKERDREVKRSEERIRERESFADKRLAQFDEREKELADRIEKVKEIKATVESAKAAIDKEFERVSGMSAVEARDILMKRVEKEAEEDLATRIRKLETTGIEELERKAKSILATIIQRVATATTSEVTTTTVGIPSDDVKGKIIGREGRNIRALERAAGVEIVVDDTPGAIVISGFDPVRRHIAKMALENLIADGRIQPARIEETVDKARAEIEKQIKEAAKNAAFEIGVFDLDERLLSLLGRLKFRTSYGQNVLQHSIEMSHMAGMLAEELGGDVAIAKKGALLHDIGKARDH